MGTARPGKNPYQSSKVLLCTARIKSYVWPSVVTGQAERAWFAYTLAGGRAVRLCMTLAVVVLLIQSFRVSEPAQLAAGTSTTGLSWVIIGWVVHLSQVAKGNPCSILKADRCCFAGRAACLAGMTSCHKRSMRSMSMLFYESSSTTYSGYSLA